jgi:hypothetical protein
MASSCRQTLLLFVHQQQGGQPTYQGVAAAPLPPARAAVARYALPAFQLSSAFLRAAQLSLSNAFPASLLAAAAPTPASQQENLLLLAAAIDPPPSQVLNWRTGTPVCTGWVGITCNAQGLVTGINLMSKGLTGQLPLDEELWSSLITLENLNLYDNQLRWGEEKGSEGA